MVSQTNQPSTTLLDIKLILCDTNAVAVDAWRQQFVESPGVEVRGVDPLETTVTQTLGGAALLLPGNSFGFLDGGLELRVCEAMGMELQDRLRSRIRSEYSGELLVGQAVIEDPEPPAPAIVYAPIWRTPQDIGATVNVFLAVKGALRTIAEAKRPELQTIVLPSMGVEPGGMHPLVSARQIRYGYEVAIGARGIGGKNLTRLIRRERKLKSIPGAGRETAPGE